jgi:ferredoxin-NADP reductase/sterol desaturase/sphingolipid hydroxylase (fatty acid hydroxylase superfamily)
MQFPEALPFYQHIIGAFFDNAINYFLFTVPPFVLFWMWGKSYFQKIRIQWVKRAFAHHISHDLMYSMLSFGIFALLNGFVLYQLSRGHTLMFTDWSQTNPVIWVATFLFVLFIDDMFFYWSHRWMHNPKIYGRVHRVHHESTDTSPFTAYAFHPLEAVIEGMTALILPFVLPMHWSVFLAWQLFSMVNNVVAHLGYELYPRGWVKLPFLRFKTASVHHNMHHQLFYGNYALYFTWWDKWIGTEFKDYEQRHQAIFERAQFPLSSDGFYLLKVSQRVRETDEALSVYLDSAPSLFKEFLPGQHVQLRIKLHRTTGETHTRTFSLSNIPNVDGFTRLTIKRNPAGQVSDYVNNHLQVGDTIELSAPQGDFCITLEPAKQQKYLLIAAGSGITPIYSMAASILHTEPKSHVTLLYGSRNAEHCIFQNEINHLQTQFPSQLRLINRFSEHNERIDEQILTKIMQDTPINQLAIYLCGPSAMMQSSTDILLNLGVNASQIHQESFSGTTWTEQDLEGVVPATITSRIFGQTHEFATDGQTSILSNAIAQNIPLPFSCQQGQCGTCKMRCVSGKVKMPKHPGLTEMQVQEGYILTCQSLPLTTHVELEP